LLVSELVLLRPATCDGRLIGLKISIAGGCHAHFSNVLSLSFGINDSLAIHEGDRSGDDFRARPFKLLSFHGQIISLLGSMASLILVSRQFLTHRRLLKSNRLPDLSLAKAAFIHVVNYFAIFRAEAVVFFTHIFHS
jgi:hypothetical protein